VLVTLIAITLRKVGHAPARTAPARPEQPRTAGAGEAIKPFQTVSPSFVAAAALVAVGGTAEFTMPERPEVLPKRAEFVSFPSKFGDWVGTRNTLESIYLDALRLDDYLLADYRDPVGVPVNFYVAYYQSQRNGMSVHSPRRCLPGGGWN